MYDVKVGFTYYNVNYLHDYTYFFLMALLSIYGGMELHMYIAQVNFKGGHQLGLYAMIELKHVRYVLWICIMLLMIINVSLSYSMDYYVFVGSLWILTLNGMLLTKKFLFACTKLF